MNSVEMKNISHVNIDIHGYKSSQTLWKQGYGKLVTIFSISAYVFNHIYSCLNRKI